MKWQARTYAYSATIPHAVEAVSVQQSAVGSYEYDANGNMTCRTEEGVVYIQEYNTENRISSIIRLADGDCETPGNSATKWDFAYDGDGVRTSTLTTPYDENGSPLTASLTAYYFGGAYETRSDGSIFKYYSFGGQSIVNEYDPVSETWELSYLLTDHLGSVLAVTNDQGTLTSQQRYLPFGGERTDISSPIVSTDFNYTGQRDLDGTGLMDYKFRFYSPVLGRFILPDSIVPGMFNPQSLNRFSYVGNNPINFNDPTGHAPSCDDWDGCKSGVKGVLKASTPTSTPTSTYTPTLTSTPTPTRTTTASNTPVPTPVDPILEDAIKLIQLSPMGQPLYQWAVDNGYTFDYNVRCAGLHDPNKKLIAINPCKSAVYGAGTIAHEVIHPTLYPGYSNSLEEEYKAYMVGDMVRAYLIAKGHGNNSDMLHPLSVYIIQFDNNPNLEDHLNQWFIANGHEVYVNPKNPAIGTPTGWGVPPFPSTFTPNP